MSESYTAQARLARILDGAWGDDPVADVSDSPNHPEPEPLISDRRRGQVRTTIGAAIEKCAVSHDVPLLTAVIDGLEAWCIEHGVSEVAAPLIARASAVREIVAAELRPTRRAAGE